MLGELVDGLVREGCPGVAACFTSRGNEMLRAAGNAEPDDVFTIGSVTKTFVAAAVLRLAQDGLLGLGEPGSTWCDLVPRDVTVRMLLDHTSRIPDYIGAPGVLEAVREHPERVWEPRELVLLGLGPSRPRFSGVHARAGLLGRRAMPDRLHTRRAGRVRVANPGGGRVADLLRRGA